MRRLDWQRINGHRSGVVWFTGLPGSGKTTLALEVEKELFRRGIRCFVLDGDRLRGSLNSDLGFTDSDRRENLRRAAEVASMLMEAGLIVLAPFISPLEADRALVRQRFEAEDFIELYVKCSVEECERRDPKGMYALARTGDIPYFTGISAPYERPLEPDLVINTEINPLDKCVDDVIKQFEQRRLIPKP